MGPLRCASRGLSLKRRRSECRNPIRSRPRTRRRKIGRSPWVDAGGGEGETYRARIRARMRRQLRHGSPQLNRFRSPFSSSREKQRNPLSNAEESQRERMEEVRKEEVDVSIFSSVRPTCQLTPWTCLYGSNLFFYERYVGLLVYINKPFVEMHEIS